MTDDSQGESPLDETPFSIEVQRRGEAVVVRLSGSCTMYEGTRLAECLKKLASEDPRWIVIEMSKLDFIESSGLGAIIGGHLRVRRAHGEVRLVAPSPPIAQLLELTRLTQLFEVYDTLEKALPSAGIGRSQ